MDSCPRPLPLLHRFGPVLVLVLMPLMGSACFPVGSTPTGNRGGTATLRPTVTVSSAQLQSRVMSMADDYLAGISEAVLLYLRRDEVTPQGRALAQSFLRNGSWAALDIGAGPNPAVNLLDRLVLASMQTRAFEDRWMPAGIGAAGAGTLVRLHEAEVDLWNKAHDLLTDEQTAVLRRLIDTWFEQNPHRTVVSLVRFVEFSDSRNISSAVLRGQANGLLREVSEVTGAIDDARLFGERVLWYTSRYPFVLGQQAEVTAFRLAAQPEVERLLASLDAIRDLAQSLNERMDSLSPDLGREQDSFFERVAAERARTIAQAEDALNNSLTTAVRDIEQRFRTQRADAVEQFFTRLAAERTEFLDDVTARQDQIRETMTELQKTVQMSSRLAQEITLTVTAVDKVAGRFAREPGTTGEPLNLADVREIALAAADTAAKTTRALEEFNRLVDSPRLAGQLDAMTDPLAAMIDRAFYRGLVLIVLLLVGLALIRLIPPRRPSAA